MSNPSISIRLSFANSVAPILPMLAALIVVGCEASAPPHQRKADKEAVVVEPDNPVPFGYKCAWLAIQTENPEGVVSALGLTGVRKSNWQKGIEAAYNGEMFVTPAVKGWVLVASFSLPEIPDKRSEDRLTPLIGALGKQFPVVS